MTLLSVPPVARTAVASTPPHTNPLTRRRCGAIHLSGGRVTWRVWAPNATRAHLVLHDGDRCATVALDPEPDGFWSSTANDVREGQRYCITLDGFECRPDPCSLWQPDGVQGHSAVFFPDRFGWTDVAWRGVARHDLVVYELHVGTFTPEGTFDAIIPRLDALKDLGVTAIELMPVAQFPGGRNWGYDGVLPYAAQNTYGGPRGLQRLVDAAHAKGLAVVLDVVYNHLGPEGAYHREFGPYFTKKYGTPWGEAINYDDAGSEPVRQYVLDNARMWLEEFHLDGLRLDAVHAIYDLGAKHVLREIQELADDVATTTGRQVHVIAESDQNDPRLVTPAERGGLGVSAQWSDDFHHAVHALLTGERRGYYADYGEPHQLAEVLASPFLYAGQFSRHRNRRHGAPAIGLAGDHFVVSIQNHDQVGNRAVGDRLTTILDDQGPLGPAKHRLASALLLLAPHVPMLFMGEEYGERRPFPFFCSFCGAELIEAVRQGRKREFADFVASADEVPDPAGTDTFAAAVLGWSWPEGSREAATRRLYKDLISARRRWPAMRDFTRRSASLLNDGASAGVLQLVRGGTSPCAETLDVYFNLTDAERPVPRAPCERQVLFASEWSRYGGGRQPGGAVTTLRPFECVALGPDAWRAAGE
ncbi:MAG TPA: malto-oligosyltrehalose trehalohydrolase [Humisphaera sp.]